MTLILANLPLLAGVAGVAGIVLCISLAIYVRYVQKASARETVTVRVETEARELERSIGLERRMEAQLAEMRRQIESLETSLRNSDEILRGDRLNYSCRARALQLLRAGIAPDSAAVTLGMPRLELRLLSKVSRMLAVSR